MSLGARAAPGESSMPIVPFYLTGGGEILALEQEPRQRVSSRDGLREVTEEAGVLIPMATRRLCSR